MSKVALFFEKMHKVFKNKAQRSSTPLIMQILFSALNVFLATDTLFSIGQFHLQFREVSRPLFRDM